MTTMEQRSFSMTYDYRCPFARNATDHVTTALRGGAPFDVQFSPFVLGGASNEPGTVSVFDDPDQRPSLVALAASIVVRDEHPDRFLDVHDALFAFRHDDGGDLRDTGALRTIFDKCELDSSTIFDALQDGWPFDRLRQEHEQAMNTYEVFGVPTFIANEHAAFLRIMSRPFGDVALATTTVETILSLLYRHPEINEFKHTSIPR